MGYWNEREPESSGKYPNQREDSRGPTAREIQFAEDCAARTVRVRDYLPNITSFAWVASTVGRKDVRHRLESRHECRIGDDDILIIFRRETTPSGARHREITYSYRYVMNDRPYWSVEHNLCRAYTTQGERASFAWGRSAINGPYIAATWCGTVDEDQFFLRLISFLGDLYVSVLS